MNKFIIKDKFLVLSKSIKATRPNQETGLSRNYGSISLYCPNTDEFEKVVVFDEFEKILARYESMKIYDMQIEANFYNGKKSLRIL